MFRKNLYLRESHCLWAYVHTYSPSGFELRLISRLTVDFDTPISAAMRERLHFLFRPRYISYLCASIS